MRPFLLGISHELLSTWTEKLPDRISALADLLNSSVSRPINKTHVERILKMVSSWKTIEIPLN
jgi:hypothetical protein